MDVIHYLVSSLEPVKVGAEKLGDRTSTLLSAEGIFSLILNELELLNNSISIKLHEAIIKRIEQIRNSTLVGMLHYLNNGKNYKSQDDTSLPVLPNKTVLILLAKKMLSRLYCTPADGAKSSSSATEEEKTVQSSSMGITEKLDGAIKTAVIEKSEPLDNNNMKHIQK